MSTQQLQYLLSLYQGNAFDVISECPLDLTSDDMDYLVLNHNTIL